MDILTIETPHQIGACQIKDWEKHELEFVADREHWREGSSYWASHFVFRGDKFKASSYMTLMDGGAKCITNLDKLTFKDDDWGIKVVDKIVEVEVDKPGFHMDYSSMVLLTVISGLLAAIFYVVVY